MSAKIIPSSKDEFVKQYSAQRMTSKIPMALTDLKAGVPPIWKVMAVIAEIFENTSGRDKVLKTIQYVFKLCVQSQMASVLTIALNKMADNIALARSVFRFGRSVHCIVNLRNLLNTPVTDKIDRFLQLSMWLFNGLWFICDHALWMWQIGVFDKHPLDSLHRVCTVSMQIALFAGNFRKLYRTFTDQHKIEMDMRAARDVAEADNIDDGEHMPPVDEVTEPSSSEEDADPVPTRTIRRLSEGNPKTEDLTWALEELRARRWDMLPDFIKNFGDAVVGFDVSLNLKLPKRFVSGTAVASGLAGMSMEWDKSWAKHSKLP